MASFKQACISSKTCSGRTVPILSFATVQGYPSEYGRNVCLGQRDTHTIDVNLKIGGLPAGETIRNREDRSKKLKDVESTTRDERLASFDEMAMFTSGIGGICMTERNLTFRGKELRMIYILNFYSRKSGHCM